MVTARRLPIINRPCQSPAFAFRSRQAAPAPALAITVSSELSLMPLVGEFRLGASAPGAPRKHGFEDSGTD